MCETMANIQYQAYFGKLLKDKQKTKKLSTRSLHSALSELPIKESMKCIEINYQ